MSRKSALINVMEGAARKAARGLVRDFGEVENLQVSKKGPADFVSFADRKAERILREELSRARPKFGFRLAAGGDGGSSRETNFAAVSSTSIASSRSTGRSRSASFRRQLKNDAAGTLCSRQNAEMERPLAFWSRITPRQYRSRSLLPRRAILSLLTENPRK